MRILLTLLFVSFGVLPASASGTYQFNRTTLSFGNTTIGMTSMAISFRITNTGGGPVQIENLAINPPEFHLAAGVIPRPLSNTDDAFAYTIEFVPDKPQTFKGAATFTIDGKPATVHLSGTGIPTGAVATVSPTHLTFPAQPVGTTSPGGTVRITNTGTTPLHINGVTTQPPFMAAALSTVLHPGESATTVITHFGAALGESTGTVTIAFDELPPSGVSLLATTKTTSAFTISTFPTLPLGTAGFAYHAVLKTSGGTGEVTWKLTDGFGLPTGLHLESNGVISGTIPVNANRSTDHFSVTANDSGSPPRSAQAHFSLGVVKTTGASCGNSNWDVRGTMTPMVPLNDLGSRNYLGSEGGLYAHGSNVRPAAHNADGVALARSIRPLDANGNPDPNGTYVLLGIGVSTLQYEMNVLAPAANADPVRNPHLLVVNGAEPSAGAKDFADLTSPFWSTITDYLLPNAGVTAQQAVAVLFEDIDVNPSGAFPGETTNLDREFEAIARNVHTLFPNVKLMYFISRAYAAYSNPFDPASPEPYAYESGFAVREAILSQINGAPSLNYIASKGRIYAPWMSWAAYTWANGLNPRSDGLTYSCQDFLSDGRHPSPGQGSPKIAGMILNFLKTDDTTTPWFLASGK